jgi:hypothetical protein
LAGIVRENYLASHEDVAKAWLAAQWESKEWVLANRSAAADLLNRSSFGGQAADVCVGYIDHFVSAVAPKIMPMFQIPRETVVFMSGIAAQFGLIKPGQVTYEQIVPEFARSSS